MLTVHAFVVLCAVLSAASKPFRPHGNDTIASYWNLTSISTSSAAVITPLSGLPTSYLISEIGTETFTTEAPPYPIPGTGTAITSRNGRPRPTGQGSPKPSASKNNTGPACTVNIPNANVHWWYAATYEQAVGTLTAFQGNFIDGQAHLTMIPNPETFNVTSALVTDTAYTESLSYDSEWDVTWTYLEEYTVKPSAPITSVISRTAALPLPSGNVIASTDASKYDISYLDLAPASVVITGAPNSTFVATSANPFLYFTAYEVESTVGVTADDGRVSSTIKTETFDVPNAYAYSYSLKGIEDYASATGIVPEEFLRQIPQSACSAGIVQAVVTVLVVVDLFYVNFPHPNPFVVHIESTALGFESENIDPHVVVVSTRYPTSRPQPFSIPPFIEHTAAGFTTPRDTIKPADVQTAAASTHHAGSNTPQGPSTQAPTQQIIGTIGTDLVVIGPSSVVIVGSQTLRPGGPAITVGGNPVSLVPSATAIVVGGKTSGLPQILAPATQPRPPPVLTIGPSTLTANAATQFFIGPGQTLTPGGTAIIDGTVVSLAPSASFIVVGGSTQILPTAAPIVTARPEIIVGSSTFTANPGAVPTFIISGQTLAPGHSITVDGTVVSLAPSASFVVVGSSTQILPTAAHTNLPEIVLGSSTFSANPGSVPTFVIYGQTLAPGQAITVDDTTLSLASSASFVVINGATSTIANPAVQITPPPLTIGDGIFTALPGTGTTYQIGTYFLTPGGVITVADTTISLAPGATALVINGQTTFITPQTQAPITNPPLLTIGSQTFTAVPGAGTTFVIDGQTLTPGGTITVDGTTISLAPGATQLIYGSSGRSTTTALFPATTTRSQSTTRTSQASAGATGVSSEAAATTSAKGTGYSIRSSGLQDWVIFMALGGWVVVLG